MVVWLSGVGFVGMWSWRRGTQGLEWRAGRMELGDGMGGIVH